MASAIPVVSCWLPVVRHPSIWMMLPFFLPFGLISGMLNGLVAESLLEALSQHPGFGRLRTMFAKQG